jgi:hypothetical protein
VQQEFFRLDLVCHPCWSGKKLLSFIVLIINYVILKLT